MMLHMLKGKIHRATVVQAELDYVGSITVDQDLLDAAGILEYEKVQIVDVNNGSRFETYTISGERGSGMICLNGAAARCVSTGDKVIIMCYAELSAEEAKTHKPQVVFVDDDNRIERVNDLRKARSAARYGVKPKPFSRYCRRSEGSLPGGGLQKTRRKPLAFFT